MTTDTSLRERPGRVSGDATPVELALVGGAPRVMATLELACLLVRQRGARLELVYLIRVPRSLAMDAPFEEAEKAAAQTLASAQQMAERYELPAHTATYRARSAHRALLHAAEAHRPDVFVLAADAGPADGDLGPAVAELAQRMSCEVITDRLPNGPGPGHHTAGAAPS